MSETKLEPSVKPPERLSGAKRANISKSEWLPDWWVGYGKDEGCQFEGSWYDLAILAAKILREPATEVVAPNLYMPDIPLTEEQVENYTGGPTVEWPGEAYGSVD